MPKPLPRVLVVGAGPAGLAAAVHLLEEAQGDLHVELVTMGHHLGGKAATWKDPQGFVVEHGFHALFGFYERMRSLARRAGVDLSSALIPSHGRSRFFDPRTRQLHELRLSRSGLLTLARLAKFPGLSEGERGALADAAVRISRTLGRAASLEQLDDVCFRTFLLEHGAPPSFLKHPSYQQVSELAFHGPQEVSAYLVLRAMELLGHCYDDAAFFYVAGGLSELFWEPIARYFQRLGGVLRIREKLVQLEHQGGELSALHLAVPDNEGFHKNGVFPWPKEVPVVASTRRVETGFAAVICTLPVACLCELNPGDALWNDPYFGNLRNLTSVSTLSLQLWTRQSTPKSGFGAVNGLSRPLSYAVDYKPMVPEYAKDPRFGSAFQWVGAEAGFEEASDAAIIDAARADLAGVPGFEGSDQHEVVRAVLRRNRANHQRYLLTDPGTLRFRPRNETPLKRLFLAGDWLRTEVDIPTMEGAIRSGEEAARCVLDTL